MQINFLQTTWCRGIKAKFMMEYSMDVWNVMISASALDKNQIISMKDYLDNFQNYLANSKNVVTQ